MVKQMSPPTPRTDVSAKKTMIRFDGPFHPVPPGAGTGTSRSGSAVLGGSGVSPESPSTSGFADGIDGATGLRVGDCDSCSSRLASSSCLRSDSAL